jgi:hypothetical protein
VGGAFQSAILNQPTADDEDDDEDEPRGRTWTPPLPAAFGWTPAGVML